MTKIRTRLKDFEAIALGFDLNEKPKRGNAKYWINNDQQKELDIIRKYHNINFQEVKRTLNKQSKSDKLENERQQKF